MSRRLTPELAFARWIRGRLVELGRSEADLGASIGRPAAWIDASLGGAPSAPLLWLEALELIALLEGDPQEILAWLARLARDDDARHGLRGG